MGARVLRATGAPPASGEEATSLSAPTVGSLAAHLIREELVTDLGTAPSRGGRRPSLMEFNAQHGFVAGIDLGPTRTRLAVADLRGEVLTHRLVPTPQERGPAALLTRIATEVRAMLREADVPPGRLIAVGAGAFAATDYEPRDVLAQCELPYLRSNGGIEIVKAT